MKQCADCNRINSATSLFCLTCGSARLESVGDELPFYETSGAELKIFRNGQELSFDTPIEMKTGEIKGEKMKAYIGGQCVGTMKVLSSKGVIGFKSCENCFWFHPGFRDKALEKHRPDEYIGECDNTNVHNTIAVSWGMLCRGESWQEK